MTSRRLLDPTAKLLLDAADYIEEHGWCRGAFYKDGHVCAKGAVVMILGGVLGEEAEEKYKTACTRLSDYITATYGSNHHNLCPIAFFNDARGRTKEEIVHALRQAAIS